MGDESYNRDACDRQYTISEGFHYEQLINDNYHYKLYIDGLPVATILRDPITGDIHKDYFDGVPIGRYGYKKNGEARHILFNHWIFTVKTQDVPNSIHKRITGFEVEPRSYRGSPRHDWHESDPPLIIEQLDKTYRNNSEDVDALRFAFTYSIITKNDPNAVWAGRMDHYMKVGNENIHLFAILFSLLVIIGLSLILSGMMKKGLNKDFINIAKNRLMKKKARTERVRLSNEDEDSNPLSSKKSTEPSAEDVAWKRVHGDVFRKPGSTNMYACFVGAGA